MKHEEAWRNMKTCFKRYIFPKTHLKTGVFSIGEPSIFSRCSKLLIWEQPYVMRFSCWCYIQFPRHQISKSAWFWGAYKDGDCLESPITPQYSVPGSWTPTQDSISTSSPVFENFFQCLQEFLETLKKAHGFVVKGWKFVKVWHVFFTHKLCRQWWWSKIFFKPPPSWLNCLRMVESLDVLQQFMENHVLPLSWAWFPISNNKQTTNQTTNQQPTAVKRQQKQSIFCKILRLGVKANPQKCGALHVALWRPLARWSKTGLSVIGLSGENWKNWGKQVTYPRGAKISCFLFEMFKVMFYGLLSMVNHGLCCNHLKQI